MSSAGRAYRGRSAAERAAERRTRLLEAALDLIGTEGWSAATMTAICARAGLTERYFYESFSDREALYLELIDGIAADVERALRGALVEAPDDPRERLAAAGRAVLGVLGDPRRGRVALLEGLESARLQRRRREILLAFERLLRDEAAALFGPAATPPDRLELAAVALVGAMGEIVSRRLDGTLRASDEEVVAFVVELALAMR